MKACSGGAGAAQLGYRVTLAWLGGVAIWLSGCGRAASDPLSGGGSAGVAAGGGVAGAFTGSGAKSCGGAGASGGGGASGGVDPEGGASGSEVPGEGGSSSLANLPLPARCQPRHVSMTNVHCALDYTCDAKPGSVTCYESSAGLWECACGTNRNYFVDGAAGPDACAVAAGLCTDSAPELDPSSCVITQEELGTGNTCEVDLSCQTAQTADFAPGVRATLVRSGKAICREAFFDTPLSEEITVECEETRDGATYAVVAKGVASACRPFLEHILGSKEPTFEGPEVCVRETADFGLPDSCRQSERCFDSEPLSDGVSLVKNPLIRSFSCGFDDLGALGCSCRLESATNDARSPHVDSFVFGLGVAQRPASCDLSQCGPEMRAEPTGPAQCQPSSPTTQAGDSCEAFSYCDQPATLEEREVTVATPMNLRCARAADGSFHCSCAAGDETATFGVDEAPDILAACDAAPAGCLARVTLPLVPATYSAKAPDPL